MKPATEVKELCHCSLRGDSGNAHGSEFFGYKKGSFTGANLDKRGYLDEADGGTLFLDEVGEIGLNMQVKLLRALPAEDIRLWAAAQKKYGCQDCCGNKPESPGYG